MAKEPVRFLLRTADAPGGVARSVLSLAGELASTYEVEVVSLFRRRNQPVFPVPDGVRLTYLQDHRRGDGDVEQRRRLDLRGRLTEPLRSRPSRLIDPADPLYEHCTMLTDAALIRAILAMRSGVLVTTRPSLLAAAARLAPRRLVLIGQEHINAATRPEPLKALVRGASRADGLVVLTERDARDWRGELADAIPVHAIPNAVPWQLRHDDVKRAPIVVVAGRLVRQKGFDRLIAAFAAVAVAHPRWRLHIHGTGSEHAALQRQIEERGLTDRVQLLGFTDRMDRVLAEASVFALSSRFEGFPMVLLEALGCGLPVVAFDCPRGPRELVGNGENGYLVPNGDVAAFTAALSRLMGDADLRAVQGRAALRTAEDYTLEAVGARWRCLIDGLAKRQVKMLTPPGPTSRPTTISTMPQSISPRTSVTIPETTSTTAMIHSTSSIAS